MCKKIKEGVQSVEKTFSPQIKVSVMFCHFKQLQENLHNMS